MKIKRITKYLDSKIIGVTGGMGSGQSTVCKHLAALGCKVINVDKKAKEIINKDSTLKNQLKKSFGKDIFEKDGTLNSRQLARLAFTDEFRTGQLNKLVHPIMVAEIIEEMETARFLHKFPLIVIDAALIYEISIEPLFDSIIVVYANLKDRIQRVMVRDQIKRAEIMARVARQIPLEEKRDWAEFVIDNNGSIEELKKKTTDIFNTLVRDLQVEKKLRI
jgi:dephospho-CoA kinase